MSNLGEQATGVKPIQDYYIGWTRDFVTTSRPVTLLKGLI